MKTALFCAITQHAVIVPYRRFGTTLYSFFYVLLTVHLSIIFVINQLNTQNLASTCFEHYVLIIRRSKLYYTESGIITPVGGRLVHRFFSQPAHRTATYRCDDTRCCIIQF